MNDAGLPDLEFDVVTKKGRKWRTIGTARLTKSGKGYACTLDTGERHFLFPKAAKGDQSGAPLWAWEEYGLD